MNENDYIELNNLLTKYRVEVLRTLGRQNDTSSTQSRNLVRQLRSIDNLRNDMILVIDRGNEYEQEPKEIQEEKVSE